MQLVLTNDAQDDCSIMYCHLTQSTRCLYLVRAEDGFLHRITSMDDLTLYFEDFRLEVKAC